MTRIDTQNLDAVRDAERQRLAGYRGMLMVCTGTGCVAAKAFDIKADLEAVLAERGLADDYLVVGTGCNGFCAMGPIVVVQPEGIFYQKLTKVGLAKIVDEHLVGGTPVKRYLHKDLSTKTPQPKMAEIPFFAKQELIALRNKGLVDPESIDSYIARDGYQALRKALTTMKPGDVLDEVKRSALRGRGGGGFPTGVKWESAAKAATNGDRPYILCNADEGDPGAFMDRSIIETDPHAVVEGMLLGAYALGATEGYIYIRKEYPLAMVRLEKALTQARERGLLGEGVMGSDLTFDIHVHRGAGAFVCGESSALMASMEGLPGEPKAKYVHSTEKGLFGKPTVLNNVETWANLPPIVEKGGEWFASIGTGGDLANNPWDGSSGTKVFSLVGDINNTGLVEVPMGITLREIIFDVGGGIPKGRAFKAVQTGGPSGGCIPESLLDEPVDFDTLTKVGSMMGSGGMIVMDDHTCMVDVARYFIDFLADESCGKCTPCREGLTVMKEILERICRGEGRDGDIEILEDICSSQEFGCLCQLGATAPNPVRSTLRYFRDEYEAHIAHGKCPGGVCKDLITYTINDKCNGCVLCAKRCPTECIDGEKKQPHVIRQDDCIQCGTCWDVCRFDAVTIE
jgi:NADH:ubiquinone oxidoreductase subunit F (NADH-binding)/(2Fe-2S) ferredoxin/Pyruvate/2-oxoacid:ferredoxin oxidoreductase delta subunit